MPSISRIRFTNLIYENGAKRYNDEIFEFDSFNGVILLDNGGGKTVFVQAVLQAILPHTPLGERKAKDTFVLGNSPTHIAVEWIISDRPRRYALTAVTLFSSKDGMDSHKYVYEYEAGDEHALHKLPFVRQGQNGEMRPSSKEEMADYYQYMNRSHLNAHYFSSNREYQAYIEENLKIFSSEWRSVARINAAEGDIERFFEGCRTTTQLVNNLLIPTVEEALAGKGTEDFVETFEKQREHFKKHRQLRDKIEESQQVDRQIDIYVKQYAVYDEAWQSLCKTKGETRSVYGLVQKRREQIEHTLAEHQQACEQLQEQESELERKRESYTLASLEEELNHARQVYEQHRQEYNVRDEECRQKNGRLQSLEIARLKALIRDNEEKIQYYTEQIKNLATDHEVKELELRINNNAGFLRYCFLQEEGVLEHRKQEIITGLELVRKQLQLIEKRCKDKQRHYVELREKRAQAELQRDQAERDMRNIAGQILANPLQENVLVEKPKWEQRIIELEKILQESRALERQLQEERRRIQGELAQMRPELQKCSREEQSLKDRIELIQEEEENLLIRMKELDPDLYSVHSLYTQQGTVLNQLEALVENRRVNKEKAILKESQAAALHAYYENSSYFGADPLVETLIDAWREQFSYLEAGAVYAEKAAQQLSRTVSEYFQAYPFWAISLVCRSSEADKLLARLRRQTGLLTHPVFVLTQEEARNILDNVDQKSYTGLDSLRQVFPARWEVNLSSGAFQSWKTELEKNAREASLERQEQESQLQLMLSFLEQLRGFYLKYPYEENRELQQSWQETREQMLELEQHIRTLEERQEEIDARLNGMGKKIGEMAEEHTHISNRILKAHEYIRKGEERDKARLDLQQCLELLKADEQELAQLERQKEWEDQKIDEMQRDLYMVEQELQALAQGVYQEVKTAFPKETKLSRSFLELERQDLLDSLRQKQKGREHLEDLLNQARQARRKQEQELSRKRRQCDAEIDEDLIFPPGGDEEIDITIQQVAELKQLLKRLEPGLKQSEEAYIIARDRFNQQENYFFQKYSERVTFIEPLAAVQEKLGKEYEEIQLKQNYLNERMTGCKAEGEKLRQTIAELERNDGRYEYLHDKIVPVELPTKTIHDLGYQPMLIVNGYINELREKQAYLDQVSDKLDQERKRLEVFCQEKVTDPRLRRMVMAGLQYRDNYNDVIEWKNRLSSRIALAIRHAEDDMREHDRELQQFINHLHSYLLTLAAELRIIPRKTRVKVEDNWKEIFQFDVPAWDEKEGKAELRRHVDWMISQIEGRYQDENGNQDYALIRKDIEKWLQIQQLLSNVMKDKSIKVKCRKVTADGKVSSHPSSWEASNQWSGGEKWSKNMALFLGIQNYLAEKRQAVNPRVKRNRAVILDNPFGKASSGHVLDPVFFIAEQLGFQIIALTALAEGKFVSDYFPVVYSCRLRPTTSPDKYLISAEQEIKHAYFQDHEPEALRRLGQQQQMELF